MRLALVPRTTEFYELFAEAGANALEAARQAERRFRELPEEHVRQEDIKALEHEGDRLTRTIIELLNTQYVTPFDREDIYALARAIDDVVDHIEEACDLLGLYKVETAMQQALEQCRILVGTSEHLATLLDRLKALRDVERHLTALKTYEDEGDRILRDALAALFDDEEVDPRVIIRWKDIFEALEEAIDAVETAGNVIGNIAVKNA